MRFVFFVLVVLAGLPLGAVRLEPLAEVAARPSSGPALDLDGLIELSLVLSGTPADTRAAYQAALTRWNAEFQTQIKPSWDQAHLAEALLLFLHSHLKSYSTNQTRVDVLVDRGTFNCVSSALVYMILGRAAGLDVQAVATDDHAFALVRLAGREVDVETTTKYGFDPGTKTEFTNSFGHTGFAYVPPGNYSKRKTIGDRQLLGLLVQNRMADFEQAGKSEDNVGLAVDRWIMEGTPEAFRTLVDGFTNFAARLNSRQDYVKGLELVDQMVAMTGPVPEAKNLAWAFLNNRVNALLEKGDYAGAQALTVSWKNRGFLTETQAAKTFELIADQQLGVAVKTLPYAQAAAAVEKGFSDGAITAARRQEMLTYVYGQEVQRVAAKGAQAAFAFLTALPAEVQALPSLVKAKEIYAYNWGVEIHNRFATLWNAGKKAEARQLLQDALASLPDNAMLKKDLVLSQAP